MKYRLPIIAVAFSAAFLTSGLRAVETDAAAPETKHEKHVVVTSSDDAGPGRIERRIEIKRAGPTEMVKVPFLGIETGPVDPTLSAQLGLAPGTGLVVNAVLPDTPAAGALAEHDLLLRLNDQILVDMHQLSVLVRNMKAGDAVTLTYLRAGKSATATVKLAEHEVAKHGDAMYFSTGRGAGLSWNGAGPAAAPIANSKIDNLLFMMEAGRDRRAHTVENRRVGGDRTISVIMDTRDGTMNYTDDQGSLEVVTKDGKKSLTAKDPAGKLIFDGPINTPDEKAKLPDGVRERLEKIEDAKSFQFHTDEDFEGGETKVLRPLGEGVIYIRPKSGGALRRLDTM